MRRSRFSNEQIRALIKVNDVVVEQSDVTVGDRLSDRPRLVGSVKSGTSCRAHPCIDRRRGRRGRTQKGVIRVVKS